MAARHATGRPKFQHDPPIPFMDAGEHNLAIGACPAWACEFSTHNPRLMSARRTVITAASPQRASSQRGFDPLCFPAAIVTTVLSFGRLRIPCANIWAVYSLARRSQRRLLPGQLGSSIHAI